MYRSFEYSIEAWPGTVRIHCGHETEDQQTIELSPEQVPAFIVALQEQCEQAVELGKREDAAMRQAALCTAAISRRLMPLEKEL